MAETQWTKVKPLAYDTVFNAAFCQECAPLAMSGETPTLIGIDPRPGDVIPITIEDLQRKWSASRQARCCHCDAVLWDSNPHRAVRK